MAKKPRMLTGEQEEFLKRCWLSFWTPSETANQFVEIWGDDEPDKDAFRKWALSKVKYRTYHPNAEKWRQDLATRREEWMAKLLDCPMANKRVRLELLEKEYRHARKPHIRLRILELIGKIVDPLGIDDAAILNATQVKAGDHPLLLVLNDPPEGITRADMTRGMLNALQLERDGHSPGEIITAAIEAAKHAKPEVTEAQVVEPSDDQDPGGETDQESLEANEESQEQPPQCTRPNPSTQSTDSPNIRPSSSLGRNW